MKSIGSGPSRTQAQNEPDTCFAVVGVKGETTEGTVVHGGNPQRNPALIVMVVTAIQMRVL
jgi:hypothetical protein